MYTVPVFRNSIHGECLGVFKELGWRGELDGTMWTFMPQIDMPPTPVTMVDPTTAITSTVQLKVERLRSHDKNRKRYGRSWAANLGGGFARREMKGATFQCMCLIADDTVSVADHLMRSGFQFVTLPELFGELLEN